jgi:hypothetical protein
MLSVGKGRRQKAEGRRKEKEVRIKVFKVFTTNLGELDFIG